MGRAAELDLPTGAIAVIGAGAMGTVLAALLGRVSPVVCVCRNGERAASLRLHGAAAAGQLNGRSGPIVVPSTADLASAGPLRAIFVTTKTTSIPAVAEDLRALLPLLGESRPFVVSFQNGIEPGRELMRTIGSDRVLRMVLNFGARLRDDDGTAECTGVTSPSFIGCLRPEHRDACRALADLLTAAGLPTRFDDRIEQRVWTKGVLNASMSPVAALVNATVGEVLDSPSRVIVDRLLREGFATAAAEGLDLGPDPMARAWATLEMMRPHTPSMVEDIRSGRESEVGQLNRQIVEHALRVGVAAPTHRMIQALIETFDWRVYLRRPTSAPRRLGEALRT